MQLKISLLKSRYLQIAIMIIQMLYLISKPDSLRNSQLLVDAGESLINKQSPYSTPNPYGSLPGLLFYVIDKLAFFNTAVFVIVILNLFGYFVLIKFCFPRIDTYISLLIMNISLFTSPIRALADNVQNNGIIIGSTIFGIYCYQIYLKKCKRKYLNLTALFFIFSLEMKPQVVLPIILIYFVQQKDWGLILRFLIWMISIRLTFNLWTGQLIELEQFEIWKSMRTNKLAIREQISIWKAIDNLFPFALDWFLISLLFTGFCSLVVIFVASKIGSDSHRLLILGLFIPLFSGYVQYYSLLPLIAVLAYQLTNTRLKNYYGSMFGLTVLALPTYSGSHIKSIDFAVVILLNIFLALSLDFNKTILVQRLFESLTALFTVSIISSYSSQLETGLSFLLLIILIFQTQFIVNSLKSVFKKISTNTSGNL